MAAQRNVTVTVNGERWTPQRLAEARQALKAEQDALKLEREQVRKLRQEAFEATFESFQAWLTDVELTHEIQVWHKKDREGNPTAEVRAHGFYVDGKATVTVAGRMREVKARSFIEWSPTGGSAPEDLNAQD